MAGLTLPQLLDELDSGFVCADIYHAFNGPAGTKAAAGLLGPDYTHPSQLGNDTIERVLKALGYAPLA